MDRKEFLNFLSNDIRKLKQASRYKCGKCNKTTDDSIKTICNNRKMYFCCIGCFEKKSI